MGYGAEVVQKWGESMYGMFWVWKGGKGCKGME